MIRKKKKKPQKDVETKSRGDAPEGFWRQAYAFSIGAVVAPLLILAMTGAGGGLPKAMFGFTKWLFGIAAYLLPVILFYASIRMFKSEQHKVSRSAFWGLILILASISGLAHLGVDRNLAAETAGDGESGGMLGYFITLALLPLLDVIGTGLVLVAIGFLAMLFIIRVPVKQFMVALLRPFRRRTLNAPDAAGGGQNAGFQLNEGVPIEKGAARHSSFKNTAEALTAELQRHNALTTTTDPDWELPGLELLNSKQDEANPGDVKGNAELIKHTLQDFNIDVEMEGANVGPRVTQYTLRPPAGVRLSKITSLDNNLALNLAAESIRIEAPIPGKSAVGIEVPNQKPASVRLHGILDSKEWQSIQSPLAIAIGRDIAGNPIIADLDNMPHLLVAGQTGSGKSVMINSILTSLLYRNSPARLRMILVDPKQVELKLFDEVPHLLTPVINSPEKTISALKWAVAEMERRLKSLSEANRRNIGEYNARNKEESMPYIVIVIDELADLMMMAARDVEALVVRLAQKSRAVGIHLVLATQRPSVDVITGLIKANVPARIAFTTVSQVDSRTILDQVGAEKLLGLGDMLFSTAQMSKPKRLQGALIETDEVEKVTDFIRMQRAPEYNDDVVNQAVQISGGIAGLSGDAGDDTLYDEAVQLVVETGKASTSFLQRRFSIGYTRAARLIDMMEERGVVAPAHGNKPRQVLVSGFDDFAREDDESTTENQQNF